MAFGPKPTETEYFGRRVVKRYDLPNDADPPIIMVDVDEDSYTAEWEVDLDLPSFEDLVRDRMNLFGATVTASFEPENEDSFRVDEEAYAFWERGDLPYPEDCTYLVVKTDEYDAAWEYWEDRNRVMLNVDSHDIEVLEEFFLESTEDTSITRLAKQESLDQARRAIQSNP